jgi:diaminopimelate decarboxylase
VSDYFRYRDDRLCADELPLAEIAERWGTPCYVYGESLILANYRGLAAAFAPRRGAVCYAVKANSNLAVLQALARAGSGFDIVSGGELARVLRAGGEPAKVVFSGACKLPGEIREALLAGVRCLNVESDAELAAINRIAGELGVVAPVAFRVNPDVDGSTHPHIATGLDEHKFGISLARARSLAAETAAMPHVRLEGIGCHIGSQLLDLDPLAEAATSLASLAGELLGAGLGLRHVDVGGGLGIAHRDVGAPGFEAYADAVTAPLAGLGLDVLTEPGRAIVGPAGVLLTRVIYLKHRTRHRFALVDAAMNDLLRPALYAAWHDILPCRRRPDAEADVFDVVGPVCETADFLGRGRRLAVREGDLLAVMDAGAYGFTMASNYNSRPRCAEIMVTAAGPTLVRARETLDDLTRGEVLL